MNLGGRSVLLTGASGGIGAAAARALAARNATVIVTGRNVEALEALATEIAGRAIPVDLSEPDGPERLLAAAGHVDVLVANAALSQAGEITSLSPAEVDRVLAVNLRAPLMLARLLAQPMSERRSGHLVFVSSLQGKAASPLSALYTATKFGLRGFSLSLRLDLTDHGVGVSCVSPGFVRGAGMFADSGAGLPPGIGTVTPEAVAAAIVRAIEGNRAEVDVAPLTLRAGARIAGVAPVLAATVSKRFGASIARAVEQGREEQR
ncbi:MAG TPA: SDR family NAD(P)-dependent oxidoreductase [Solirubrobacteraceae bacterium]|nr:SDR family NAD(P)-dependent oxidoreductase [Solirubrobacteraceae bacterium]